MDYFGGTGFIGRTVTIDGTITRVITEATFEVDSRVFGDDSLLVLCAPNRQVAAGDRVTVRGNVQVFGYGSYVDEYPLATDATVYDEFEGETFLVTAEAMRPL